MNKILKSPGMKKAFASLLTIGISLLISLIIFFIMSPLDALYEFGVLVTGGLGYFGLEGFFDILAEAAPLICCGLAILFAFKTGLFNIGAAGQYVIGSFASLMFTLHFGCNWFVATVMAIVFGAIWGLIPSILKAYCKVSEVISGIMLNWIALFFVNHSFQTYLSDCVNGTQAKTYEITGIYKLPDLGLSKYFGNNFTIAIFIALLMVVVIWVILEKTTLGYQIKASGLNSHATRYAGINDKANLLVTMAISGALAGLGGALFHLAGLEQWQVQASSALPGMPWNGIVVAFIAQLSPIASIFVAIFISFIAQGSIAMSQSIFPVEFGDLITGIIVYLSGLTSIIMMFVTSKLKKKEKAKGAE